MSDPEREYVEALERRIRELERRRPSVFGAAALVLGPLAAVGMLSGSAPATGIRAVESRLAVLESLISLGPDGSAQTRAPFQVLDASGKVLFVVGDRDAPNAVQVKRVPGDGSAGLRLLGPTGSDVANLAVDASGGGRISNFDAAGDLVAQLNPAGLNVYAGDDGKPVAGVTQRNGRGRVAVWRDGSTAVELVADAQGNGLLNALDANGKIRVSVRGKGEFGVFEADENNVVQILSRNGRGIVGVSAATSPTVMAELTVDSAGGGVLHMKAPDGRVALGLYAGRRTIALGNGSGQTVAEMKVHPSGYGLFQVWDGGKAPLAVLGKAPDRPGGIVQISNGTAVVGSITASPQGNGYWQLNDRSGTPMVEVGVQDNGLGTVRAGPRLQCIHKTTGPIQELPDCLRGRRQ